MKFSKKLIFILILSSTVFALITLFILLYVRQDISNGGKGGIFATSSSTSEEGLTFSKVMTNKYSECRDIGVTTLNNLPIPSDSIVSITPMGDLVNDKLPTNYITFNLIKDKETEVRGIGGSTLIEVEKNEDGSYKLILQFNCEVGYVLDTVILNEEDLVRLKVGSEITSESNLGKAKNTLNLSIYNVGKSISGILNKDSYKELPGYVYSVDPLTYFDSEISSLLREKSLRRVSPSLGKIGIDDKGKLVGTYFLLKKSKSDLSQVVSFSYDKIDPGFLIFSTSNYLGKVKAFSIKGNLPDFSEIDVNNKLVKYELSEITYIRKSGLPIEENTFYSDLTLQKENGVLATLLIQVLDDSSVKLEVIENTSKDKVYDFSEKALIYVR